MGFDNGEQVPYLKPETEINFDIFLNILQEHDIENCEKWTHQLKIFQYQSIQYNVIIFCIDNWLLTHDLISRRPMSHCYHLILIAHSKSLALIWIINQSC